MSNHPSIVSVLLLLSIHALGELNAGFDNPCL